MVSDIIELLGFAFVRRALLAGVMIAAGCALLGVFLVLRRMAMMGEGMSHFAFGAVGLALFLDRTPLWVALPLVVLASLLVMRLPERTSLFGDAAIGMVSALGIATGVLLAAVGDGFDVDLFGFLFGDILAVSAVEVWLSLSAVLAIGLMVLFFYHELFTVTFDTANARVFGVSPAPANNLLAVLTGILVVLGIRVVGTLLVSSLLIFPSVSALQWRLSFKATLMLSVCLGVFSVLGGMLCALAMDLPAGAAIVVFNALLFAFSAVAGACWRGQAS